MTLEILQVDVLLFMRADDISAFLSCHPELSK
jgi:hypothetical protein